MTQDEITDMAKQADEAIHKANTPQPKQEQANFCERCGKRLGKNDWDIHTCTPPQPKQEQDEPVAWMQEGQPELYVKEEKDEKRRYVIPLYTTPQPRTWVGLTDEELKGQDEAAIARVRYWEAKLKDKNT